MYYGYVYEWTNTTNGKKYIGSHYGQVEDYYIGSGKYFKRAYRKNPNHFSMQVLEYSYINDKKLLLSLEQKWLDTVPNIKDNKLYYNCSNFAVGGSSHLKRKHIIKRSKTLVEKHKKNGLSDAEINSYKVKTQSKLDRIATTGFTDAEIAQHNSYGCTIEVTYPNGDVKIFPSFAKATKAIDVDCRYGASVCLNKPHYKGYTIKKLADPTIDCRNNRKKG